MNIAKIVFSFKHYKSFVYFFDKSKINLSVGSRVVVPFRNKYIIGIVVSLSILNKKILISNIKHIKYVLDKDQLYFEKTIYFFKYISNYYFLPLGKILFNFLPSYFYKKRTIKKKNLYILKLTKLGNFLRFTIFKKKSLVFNFLSYLNNIYIYYHNFKLFNIKKQIIKYLLKKKYVNVLK
ncbi:hypothetical protein RJX39_00415 [Buchnera aphidicola (Taiwanaphis decaspermi)]|uniref:primosomal protein N' family DNA-binding protein n=1 Tax=Buchnera aphidicola TaxID=9 RepID=UPI0031B87678